MFEHARDIDARAIERPEKQRVLEHAKLRLDAVGVADPADKPAAFFRIGNGIARAHLQPDVPGRLRKQPGKDAQRRTFSRAIRPLQGQHLPRGRSETDVLENAPAAPLAGEILHFDERENGHGSYMSWPARAGHSAIERVILRAWTCAGSGAGSSPPGSIHMLAAIDGERGAGNKPCLIPNQESQAPAHVI